MQQRVGHFSTACDNFGFTISTKKTKVMHQPAPQKTYEPPTITVKGETLEAVDKFTYLGSTLSRSVNIDTNSGTWTVYGHGQCMNVTQKSYKVPDPEVLPRTGLPSIYTLLKRAQVRWAGHLGRMPDRCLPKRLFCGELAKGKRSQGGQKKRYKDCLKASLKGTQALDRLRWRSKISKGAIFFEQNRLVEAQWKREIRKSKAASLPPAQGDHLCPVCGRAFRARTGLSSYMKHYT